MNKNINTMELAGISVSGGIAVGVSYCFKNIDLEATKKFKLPVTDTKAELQRLFTAVNKSRDQLSVLVANAKAAGKTETEQIFFAQSLLLDEKDFLREIGNIITKEKLNAEYVLAHQIDALSKKFAAIKNEIIRTKSLDIQDVYYRLLRNLLDIEHVRANSMQHLNSPVILVAEKLLPSDIALIDRDMLLGIVVEQGSTVSHVAIIARAAGIPEVINVPGISAVARNGTPVIIDGDSGTVIINPTELQVASYKNKQKQNAHYKPSAIQKACTTKDGIRIHLEANAGSVDDVQEAMKNGAEGIGLFRTELYYLSLDKAPTVKEESDYYRRIIRECNGKPVTLRLLDVGADKSPPFLNIPVEESPQLGIKGIRYLLSKPDLFKKHITSIVRASAVAPVRVLIPFVSIIDEVEKTRRLIHEICSEENTDESRISLGIMVEIPSVALSFPRFAQKADFFSIGTNDLVQYSFAASRENGALEEYRKNALPVVMGLIRYISACAAKLNKEVTVCGEIASHPQLASQLVGAGIRCLSVQSAGIQLICSGISAKILSEHEAELRKTVANCAPFESIIANYGEKNV